MQINRKNSPAFKVAERQWRDFVENYTGPFDLSRSVYRGQNHPTEFKCPTHGWGTMAAKYILQGKGCVLCYREGLSRRPRITQKKTLARFVEVHGDTYDYSRVQYRGQQVPVEILCKRHGSFFQKPEFHWTGSGCPQCYHEDVRGASQRLNTADFVDRASKYLPPYFDFSLCDYKNSNTPVTVRCTQHNLSFSAPPRGLMAGENPCPRCNHMKSSAEDQVARFLSTLTTVVQRDRTIIGPKELDIYMPEHKLAVEYCGMYWHSHGDKDDERKNKLKHAEKHRLCTEQGIRLITLYESEWLERPATIRRLLRNAVGKTRGKLMARKCSVGRPSPQEARAFYEKYHPQGGNGHGEHFGLYHKGKLVACMRFNYGANDRGAGAKVRQWTLSRYATRLSVAGAASRLFKAFVAEYSPAQVKSFSDNRFFGGQMYEQLGFVLEEEVAPDYQVWSSRIGLRPKPHYQRRVLQKRLEEHGSSEVFDADTDQRTEAEITYLMGARRIYDCGKKRWVWTAGQT
jgi:very-short-patch-repair endonuclease